MRRLLQQELTDLLPFTVAACSLDHLSENQGPAIGALIVSLPGRVWSIASLLPRWRQVYGLVASSIDDHVARLRRLKAPSLIFIVSISDVFLQTARSVIAPMAGNRHAIEIHCLANGTKDLSAADLVFCDSISLANVQAPHVVHYRLVSIQSAQEIQKLVIPAKA